MEKANIPTQRLSDRRIFLLLSGFLFFYLGLQLTRSGPPTLGRTICFTQFTDSNVNIIQKYPCRHTHNSVWPNIQAHCDPGKLSHESNQHSGCLGKGNWRLTDDGYKALWEDECVLKFIRVLDA